MNQSLWILSTNPKKYDTLNENTQIDNLIIGGGIVGVTTAYLLAKQGKDVLIAEADSIGYGTTGRNTGKITTQHGVIYSKINNQYDLETAKLYYKGNDDALNLIKDLINENDIECNFEKVSSFIYTEDENYIQDLKDEYEVCKNIGINCKYYDSLDIPFNVKGGISFNNQYQFNPKKYIDELANKCIDLGVKIYENTPIVKLEKGNICIVETSKGHKIKAKNVILASHFPWYDGLNLYFAKEKGERSYLLGCKTSITLPNGIYISAEEPTKTFRTYEDNNEKYLIIGGNDHKVGQYDNESEIFDILKEYAKEKFKVDNFEYKWSAQDYMSYDNIPFIGHINKREENIYVATGFSKWGITNGTLSAIILSDLIIKDKSKYENIFNTSRKGSILNTEFVKENLNVGLKYIGGKLQIGSKEMPIEKGEGKVVNIDGKRYGAYKDYNNELYIVDITCTHLGCELHFNSEEKTWDCPCHASRFDYKGDILNGPALRPLNKYNEEKNKVDPKLN